jgi:hypothetical protein
MKIGIVTFWQSDDNYGQLLQCYALQTFLRQQGHDAFLIKDIPCKKSPVQKIIHLCLHFSIRQVFFSLNYRWNKWRSIGINKQHDRDFAKFRMEHIVSTDKEYTLNMLREKSSGCRYVYMRQRPNLEYQKCISDLFFGFWR